MGIHDHPAPIFGLMLDGGGVPECVRRRRHFQLNLMF
jgi:hypothetical protein